MLDTHISTAVGRAPSERGDRGQGSGLFGRSPVSLLIAPYPLSPISYQPAGTTTTSNHAAMSAKPDQASLEENALIRVARKALDEVEEEAKKAFQTGGQYC